MKLLIFAAVFLTSVRLYAQQLNADEVASLQEAKRIYPECFEAGKRGEVAYREQFAFAKYNTPLLFKNPKWPLVIAGKAANKIGEQAATKPGGVPKIWTGPEVAAYFANTKHQTLSPADAEMTACSSNAEELAKVGRWDEAERFRQKLVEVRNAESRRAREKTPRAVLVRVIQVLDDGLLCQVSNRSKVLPDFLSDRNLGGVADYKPEPIFVYCETKGKIDGQQMQLTIYDAGRKQYIDTLGARKTVAASALTVEDALRLELKSP